MNIGITGTRSGLNIKQRTQLYMFLAAFIQKHGMDNQLHHGDCDGVDIEAAEMAKDFGFKIVTHPPADTEMLNFEASDVVMPRLSHFARNRTIVESTDLLLVIPYQDEHQDTGGTWYTHDYAIKKGKPVTVLWPNKE